MDPFDISEFQLALMPQINASQRIMADLEKQHQDMIETMAEANEERARNEEEKRTSLRKIAEYSEETVNSLKETNSILKENNRLLKEKNETLNIKLEEIAKVITELASITKEECENQDDMMKQALALAVQLNITAEENTKLSWKDVLANTSAGAFILGLQVFLHQRGVL